ncbi:MAG: SAM-dependent methyltransferase [Peptococcaceae bacterium]|nr:SAM-dependent methyltransferase [Peptococcaceae bacterium]
MNNHPITLGTRLQTIASFIKEGSVLGDIGTDHAYLPVYLVQRGIINRALGVDIHEGPYQSALETVKAYGYHQKIDIRKGNGLLPIEPGEVDFLVLAGMGGNTILQILGEKKDVLQEVNELVLQPQGAEGKVRRELLKAGWKIKDELLVEEDARIYSVIHFSRTEGITFDDVESQVEDLYLKIERHCNAMGEKRVKMILGKEVWGFGPLILRNHNCLCRQLFEAQMERRKKVAQEMQQTDRIEVKEKAKELFEEITVMEGIRCLFQ